MNILGVSCFYHDSAACLLWDGRIIAAAQEERFSRKKHDPRFPQNALKYCMDEAGIDVGGIDYVVDVSLRIQVSSNCIPSVIISPASAQIIMWHIARLSHGLGTVLRKCLTSIIISTMKTVSRR